MAESAHLLNPASLSFRHPYFIPERTSDSSAKGVAYCSGPILVSLIPMRPNRYLVIALSPPTNLNPVCGNQDLTTKWSPQVHTPYPKHQLETRKLSIQAIPPPLVRQGHISPYYNTTNEIYSAPETRGSEHCRILLQGPRCEGQGVDEDCIQTKLK